MEGRHELPRNLHDLIAGRRWFSCEPRHVHIPVTVETDSGQKIEGHITGNPDMPESTRKALAEMMRLFANAAMKETPAKAREALKINAATHAPGANEKTLK